MFEYDEKDYMMRRIQQLCLLLSAESTKRKTGFMRREIRWIRAVCALRLIFYLRLNERNDEGLEAHGFTRGKIGEGLRRLAERYGVVL